MNKIAIHLFTFTILHELRDFRKQYQLLINLSIDANTFRNLLNYLFNNSPLMNESFQSFIFFIEIF